MSDVLGLEEAVGMAGEGMPDMGMESSPESPEAALADAMNTGATPGEVLSALQAAGWELVKSEAPMMGEEEDIFDPAAFRQGVASRALGGEGA